MYLFMMNLNNLDKFGKHIFSVDGFDPKAAGDLIVAVHPYFPFITPEESYTIHNVAFACGTPEKYVKRFENLILTHNGPIVTLEEKGNINNTAERYKKIGRLKNAYFIR